MKEKKNLKNLEMQQTPETVEQAVESSAEQQKPKKKKRGKINLIINIVLIVAIILAAVCTYISFVSSSGNGVPNLFGLRLLSIRTDSMYPNLKPGDLIIDVGIGDPSELRPKDIITYWTIIDGEQVLNTHRIVNIYDGGDYLIFETKGDKNTSVDPLTVHESKLVGKYAFRIPGVGKVFDYMQTRDGFLLVVLIPVFIFFIYHLIQFFRVLFEYQNVKNRIKYEQERGKTEDLIAAQQQEQIDRAKLEAELREKLRAELLESMAKEKQQAQAADASSEESEAVQQQEIPAAQPEESETKTE